ncbi:hypothetical protein [Thermospira aquatica]|uniref:Uncharacterized protein n=1 Tax=Thermospira aquatica TaxID=2828656 RepID=A0AAX3BDQ9_9SPIR|nr:hypothetical protein [Thermospira aquatica]URA10462.1 hypothetical protein KDW03_01275 [Thermospira aquatica]
MKGTKIFLFVGVIAATLLFFGCSMDEELSDSEAEFLASQIADSVANPESGSCAELNTVAMATTTNTNSTVHTTIVFTFTNGSDSTRFSWDSTTNGYKRTASNVSVSVNGGQVTGTISSFSSRIWFYTSLDATGTGVQLVWPYTMAANSSVKSARVERNYVASLENNWNGATRTIQVNAKYTVTGINDSVDGVIVNGTRTATGTFERDVFSGNFTITHTFNNVTAIRTNINGTNCTVYDGDVTIHLTGTTKGPRRTRNYDVTTTAHFNRTRQVTVSVENKTVTVDIVTGK